MPKPKTVYICQGCGGETVRWQGQCPECGEWNSLVETVVSPVRKLGFGSRSKGGSGAAAKLVGQLKPLSKVVSTTPKRLKTKISEFDRVLGGGFVPGQAVLISGEPGIGKSTLLTQICASVADKVIYVCGEESAEQIKLRAGRMNYQADNMYMLAETDVDVVVAALEGQEDGALIIVDSIQMLSSGEYMGPAGSVGQIRGSAQKLTTLAKRLSVPLVMVGHVTKEGVVAGPKVLEHVVDTVLYIEGDSQHVYRILRATKNRFGPVSEVGVFEMGESGMREITNPSELFLSERSETASGSCVTVVMEGQRPLLFEIQALTVKTSFGYPRRTTSGLSTNRLLLLIAVLEKRCGLKLENYDVYVNVAGGFKITENACDLAVCMAIASSTKDVAVPKKVACFGEVGLLGEVRKVSFGEKRVREAERLGYDKVVSPGNISSVEGAMKYVRKTK